jgi:hypothetical protein
MPEKGYRKWQHDTRTPTYRSWYAMLTRCYNCSNDGYDGYGREGITVCERWHDYDHFYEDMGERPEGTTLGRIDNDGNYEPANCGWFTVAEQNRNTRHNVMLTFNGKTQCVTDWGKELGLKPHTIITRLLRGDDTERALRKPSFVYRR